MIFSVICLFLTLLFGCQVKVSLDSLMDSLTSLSVVGDCVAGVEHLLKELKTLQEKAQVSQYTHRTLLISSTVIKPKIYNILVYQISKYF